MLYGSGGQHCPLATLCLETNLVHIVQEAGWVQDKSGQVLKILPPLGYDPWTLTACSDFLYNCKINFVLHYHPAFHVLCWSAAVGNGGECLTSHPIHFTPCKSSPIANQIIGLRNS